MVILTDSIYIPNIGGYDIGDYADLGETLEAQIVRAGKARYLDDSTERVVEPVAPMFEPGLKDD